MSQPESPFRDAPHSNPVEHLCAQFEQSWRCGDWPDIDAFVRQAPASDRPLVREELLSLEQRLLEEGTCELGAQSSQVSLPDVRTACADSTTESPFASNSLSVVVLADVLKDAEGKAAATRATPLLELQRLATDREFAPGEFLIRQGEAADSLVVIQDGVVEIRVEQADGTSHTIDRSGPGEVLGEMALLTDEPRTASAVAAEPVRAAILPAESFHSLVKKHPELSTLLTELIATRLGNVQQDALSGKQLDRYRIRRRLGRGGMSVVYEATDVESGARAALKMMSHRLVCLPRALRRFQLEADLVERFDHPHIVKMYGRFAAFRTYFIAMEYCLGETLSRRLAAEGPMDELSFRRAIGQLAQALDYAHGEGVVHRDVKPSNVMRLENGQFKLMDFGLAEPIDGVSADEGRIVGTPRFMSPEQRAGEKVDARADYFALGCVAYEMLTGTPLFFGSTKEEMERDFRNWRPPDFADRELPLSDETRRTIQHLLAADPADRPADLQAFAAWV